MRLPREQRLGASAGVADKRVVHDIFIGDPGVLGKVFNRWPRVHQSRKRDGLPEILILFACAHHLTGPFRRPDYGPLIRMPSRLSLSRSALQPRRPVTPCSLAPTSKPRAVIAKVHRPFSWSLLRILRIATARPTSDPCSMYRNSTTLW